MARVGSFATRFASGTFGTATKLHQAENARKQAVTDWKECVRFVVVPKRCLLKRSVVDTRSLSQRWDGTTSQLAELLLNKPATD